jgi:hypothetical protein
MGIVVVVVMVVVAGMDDHDNLRLRRIGYCEAEDEHESEQNLFHKTVCRPAESEYRATLTVARRP